MNSNKKQKEAIKMTKEIKRKNAGVSAIMSALIPGLGQIYNGQIGKGILCFIVGCVLLGFYLAIPVPPPGSDLITASGLIATVLFFFWLGIIYYAYSTAKEINAGEITA